MKRKLHKVRVRRITVDEKLSDDLFRFAFCQLTEGNKKFTDRDDEWQEEREKLVHPQDYSRILDVKKSEAPAWETLQEGQVYLSGEFEVIGDQTKPEYFKVSPGRRHFLRIDNLGIIDEGVKALYSDVLRGHDALPTPIEPEDLVFHFLNVGFGDNILVEFPIDKASKRSYGIVDCRDFKKTKQYLDSLMSKRPGKSELEFMCATHPHADHISGINSFLEDKKYRVKEFWDSGFRHKSQTYIKILQSLLLQGIKLIRVSSGMERYFGKVQVTVLAPSIRLRNMYATYGVDMNNASIVLRFEHYAEDVMLIKSREYTGNVSLEAERQAGRSVVILAGDAEYDSWSQMTEEFPRLEKTESHEPLVKKMVNYLACSALKVAHHGSMHSAPLDVYEKMSPEIAVVSTEQEKGTKQVGGLTLTRELFPHRLAITALEECGAQILTTDGSYESEKESSPKKPGSIAIVVPPGGKPRWAKLDDTMTDTPKVLEEV